VKAVLGALLVLLASAPARASGKGCSEAERAKVALSPESAYWLGRAAVDQVLARYAPPGKVPLIFEPDTVAAVYLNQIGFAVVEAATSLGIPGPATAPLRGYHFFLVRDPVPTAWSFPGGFVVVTDGLLMRASSEEQVAGLLAHEVAHLQRGHVESLWRDALCRGRAAKKDAAALTDLLVPLALKAVAEGGLESAEETEADADSARILARAGYAPLGLADYLQRLGGEPGAAGLAKQHPAPGPRAQAIAALVKEENLGASGRSAHEGERTARFLKAMVEGGLRPDWKPLLDYYRR
jgi:predicted Zn-dependent protease